MTARPTEPDSLWRRRLLLAGAGWPLLPGCAQPASQRIAADGTLPMRLLRIADIGALPTLMLSLRGRPTRWLIDTGASHHFVSRRLVAEYRLHAGAGTSVASLGGPLQGRLVELPALRAGDQELAAGTAIEIDLSQHLAASGESLDGILGLPAFEGISVRLDFANRRAQFDAGAAAVAPAGTALTLPLAYQQGSIVVALALGERAPEQFMLDTGYAGALVVFPRRARSLQHIGVPLPRVTLREAGAERDIGLALLRRIRLGELSMQRVPTELAASRPGIAARGAIDRWSGALGCALFESGSLHVDLPQRRLTIEWPAGPLQLPGGFGFLLRPDGQRQVRISAVFAGSPASQADLQPGDELLEVEGRPLAGRTPSALWEAMRGSDRVQLTLRAAGGRRRVELQREDFLPPLS